MIWTIIVILGIVLLMPAGAYTYVILKSDQVAYEGVFGKFSAKASSLQIQLNNILKVNNQLTATINHLKQDLKDINNSCNHSNFSAMTGDNQNILSEKFSNINKKLNDQSNLLDQQKLDLDTMDKDLIDFKSELQTYLSKKKS